ncbi:MAG TPA: IPT/TIG domain-containing protein, partial [Abditibacteriaceae bacterium]
TVPVDSTMTAVTFSVSGSATVTVKRPNGAEVRSTDADATFITFANGKVISLNKPAPGNWVVSVSGSGSFSLKVTGEATLGFTRFEFVKVGGRPGHTGAFPIEGEPLADAPNMAHAVLSPGFKSAQFQFRAPDGKILKSFNLSPSAGGITGEFYGNVTLPDSSFLVYVIGEDKTGKSFQRVLPGLTTAQVVTISAPAITTLSPGVTTTYIFRVTNLGPKDTFTVTATDDRGFVTEVTPRNFQLDKGKSQNVTVKLAPAAGLSPDITSETLTVNVTGVSGSTNSAVLSSPVGVNRVPTITSFGPHKGAQGQQVVITGTNFTGATTVKFNGTAATFTVNSPTQITTRVPVRASTGRITVTTPAGTATSATNFWAAPIIAVVSPNRGLTGSRVAIRGLNLGSATKVTLGGHPVSFTVLNDTTINFFVPGRAAGKVSVTTPGGTATSAINFVNTTPFNSRFSFLVQPSRARVGQKILLTGAWFLPYNLDVRVNGVPATNVRWVFFNTIEAVVPAGAVRGSLPQSVPVTARMTFDGSDTFYASKNNLTILP